MKRFFISALALLGMGVMANAQEKVTIHNGSESYVTNVEYITFDATDADDAVSVSALQTEITTLTGEKTTLEGQVSTLTSEKAELATAKTTLEGQVSTLTSEKAELATAKTTLEGQVSTLTSEKAELATAKTTLEGQISTLTSEKAELATAKTTLEGQVSTLTSEKAELATAKTTLEGQVSTLTSEKEVLESDLAIYKQKYLKLATNDHDYVDLGLTSGTLWATYNVGASKPEEYGDYFAWGETETKESYDWITYKWCNGKSIPMTKYCTNSPYGTVDNKATLEKADDAATANWGGSWRMPTYAEWEELYNNTTQTWTNDYEGTGVKGYILTSKKKGYEDAFIFLPAAGRRENGSLMYEDYGFYWSSSLHEDYSSFSRNLNFNSGKFDPLDYKNRNNGLSVRPVCPGK